MTTRPPDNNLSTPQDVYLLKIGVTQFEKIVREALEALRDGDFRELGGSPLALSSLVVVGLLRPQPLPAERGRALQSILQWGIDLLQPGGERDWSSRRWLSYNIVQSYYIEGERIADIAERSGYSDIHVLQSLRPRALAALAHILQDELTQPHDEVGRERYCATTLYEQTDRETGHLLALLATLNHAVPVGLLHQLLPPEKLPILIQKASQQYLIDYDEIEDRLSCHPMLQNVAKLHALPHHQKEWLAYTATYFANKQEWIVAVDHARQAGQFGRAAEFILTQWHVVLDTGEMEDIQRLRSQLQTLLETPHLSDSQRANLQLASGQIAEFLGELDEARQAYAQTINTSDTAIKGLALYRLAELSKQQESIDLAMAYYQRAVALLTGVTAQAPLLAALYIARAMIYIQERPDLEQAQTDLAHANSLMSAANEQKLWADLHNGWASYYYQQKDLAAELNHRLQAWLAAVEANDFQRMLNTSHNLGQAYAWRQQYEAGLPYLQKSLALAKEAGNQHMIGVNHKTIGNIYFWQEEYGRVETHYQAAHKLFTQIGNRNWLGYMCYELAELYAHTGQWAQARRYWKEGDELARSLGNEMLGQGLAALITQFPLFQTDLNERQQKAVNYMLEQGAMTNKIYCEIGGCSQVTAARDLKECVTNGVMQKVGKGRSTQYLLV